MRTDEKRKQRIDLLKLHHVPIRPYICTKLTANLRIYKILLPRLNGTNCHTIRTITMARTVLALLLLTCHVTAHDHPQKLELEMADFTQH